MESAIDHIKVYIDHGKKKARVPAGAVLGELYADTLPDQTRTFTDIVKDLQDFSKRLFFRKDPELTAPTGGAFNNCNGFWAEYIYSAFAWNRLAEINQDPKREDFFVFVKLPNNRDEGTNWVSLLKKEFQEQVGTLTLDGENPDIRSSGHKSFSLSSSNPDAIIVKVTKDILTRLPLDPKISLSNLSSDTMARLNNDVFEGLRGCIDPFDNIQCFLSIKKSTRPDRRLQFIHEGNSVKCLLHFLIQRSRSSRAPRKKTELAKKYYAVSLSDVSPKDEMAMDTASISTVQDAPDILIWAVDQIFSNKYPSDISSAIDAMVL